VNIDSHYTGLPVDAICIRFIFMNSLRGESPIAEADRTRLRHECVTGKVTEIGGLNQPTTPRELPDSNLFVIARV
jgi:hypothetical protein